MVFSETFLWSFKFISVFIHPIGLFCFIFFDNVLPPQLVILYYKCQFEICQLQNQIYMMQEQNISESKKYLNQKLDKNYQISIKLIAETSLQNTMTNALSEDEKIQLVLELRSIHLEWLNIKKIQNLEVFTKLNVLYLQNNQIRKIQHLQCLQNLQYLALNDNQIEKVQNLKCLKNLRGLNLNNNNIQEIDGKQLPQALQLLSFKNNPVTLDANYKRDILKCLKCLQMLDDEQISPEQRFKTLGVFPQKYLQYSNKMKQFKKKKQIKEELLNIENKPILMGAQNVNQKQALTEIRQKTRKYLEQNQESFKQSQSNQIQNFNEKILVSKNVRHIKQEQQKSRKQKLQDIRTKKLQEIQRQMQQIKRSIKSGTDLQKIL